MARRILGLALVACVISSACFATPTSATALATSVTSSLTGTQQTTLAALTAAAANDSSVYTVLQSLAALPAGAQQTALTQLSGSSIPSATAGTFEASNTFTHGMQGRMDQVRLALAEMPEGAAGPATANCGNGLGVWVQALAGWADQDNMNQSSETKYGYDSDTQGFIVGLDKTIDRWVIGFSTGGTWTDVDVNDIGAETDIDAWQIGPYVSFNHKSFYLDFGGAYAASDIDSARHITFLGATAKGETEADTWSTYLNAGYNFCFNKFTLTPTAGLSYIYTDTDGYTETGAAGANLQVKEGDTDTWYLRLGARGSYAISQKFSVNAVALWNHDFENDTPSANVKFAGGNYFKVKGLRPDDDTFTLGLGAIGQITQQVQAFANYDYTFGDEYDAHNVSVGIRLEF